MTIKIHVKNQTGKKIDICCGLEQELTLLPEQETILEVQDEDCLYIDQVTK